MASYKYLSTDNFAQVAGAPIHESNGSSHSQRSPTLDPTIPDFEKLARLPDEILLTIFNMLDSEYIQEFLLHLPATRSFIQSEYYPELHFVISPTRRPYVTSLSSRKRQYCTYKSYFDITQFLDSNKDFVPKKLLLVSGGDFHSLGSLLTNYRDILVQIPALDITIDTHYIDEEDISLLLSFPNLQRVHFSAVDMSMVRKFLQQRDTFRTHPGLQNVIFLGHSIYSWKDIRFPSNINHLDLSWTKTDPLHLSIPDSITELYLNNAGITSENLAAMKLPDTLKTLMMTYNKLETFDLEVLPPSLETVDLSFNGISKFTGHAWPASLKSIFLASNHLGDMEMRELSSIPWPETLVRLSVEANIFTDLRDLGKIPNLEWLDIGMCEIQGFEGFEFPSSLRYLRMGSCERIRWPAINTENPASDSPDEVESTRLIFPPSLLELDLMSCKIPSLHYFSFPRSLIKLALSGNRITSLSSYEDENHSWSKLDNLTELDLFKNNISTLDDWVPPSCLKMLDLSDNRVTSLASAPLFDSGYKEQPISLRSVNLAENSIRTIDEVNLPENLISLNISKNLLENVAISPGISAHSSLRELDLSKNTIRSLRFIGKGEGRIQVVDLTGNLLLKGGEGGASEIRTRMGHFYDDFEEGFGVKVQARKFNVNSVHKLVPR